MLKSLGYSISTLCQIFFYMYGGDRIHEESDSIVNSYFNSNWYEATPRQRKDIVSAMIMAQSGTRIDAGLLELSLKTFAKASDVDSGVNCDLMNYQDTHCRSYDLRSPWSPFCRRSLIRCRRERGFPRLELANF